MTKEIIEHINNVLCFCFYLITVLCGNRVSQMTRTYDDIQAVTRLLEEKEKDLELTVQIGKELLTQNNRLENRVGDLEGDIKAATEHLAQLSHELHQKNDLISILTNDVDDSGSENGKLINVIMCLECIRRKKPRNYVRLKKCKV